VALRSTSPSRVVVVVVVVVEEMNIIKVALSHFCCRTTVQSDSVSVARQVCFLVVYFCLLAILPENDI